MQKHERFVAEYRESGPSGFRSEREDFSRDEVAKLLDSYLAGGDAWRTRIQWRPLERPRDVGDTLSNVCMVAALAAFFAAGLSLRSSGRAGASGTDPMDYLFVGSLLMLTSSFIDMRRFREVNARGRVRTIAMLLVGMMIIVFYLLDR